MLFIYRSYTFWHFCFVTHIVCVCCCSYLAIGSLWISLTVVFYNTVVFCHYVRLSLEWSLILSTTVGLLSNTNVSDIKSLTKITDRHWGWHHECKCWNACDWYVNDIRYRKNVGHSDNIWFFKKTYKHKDVQCCSVFCLLISFNPQKHSGSFALALPELCTLTRGFSWLYMNLKISWLFP